AAPPPTPRSQLLIQRLETGLSCSFRCCKGAGCVFPMEKWLFLDPRQRALYRDVMQESYETLMSLSKELSAFGYGKLPLTLGVCTVLVSKARDGAAPRRGRSGERPEARPGVDGSGQLPAGEEPSLCPECGESFPESAALLTHRRSHARQGSYPCPECGESFIEGSALLAHRRAHAGQAPGPRRRPQAPGGKRYRCSECGERFRLDGKQQGEGGRETGEVMSLSLPHLGP
uniref:Uncharacterized protein n=1 Tax=Chelydra serpentina TaxID=8475 RepID=A0A8C3XU32_CHESE